MRKSGYELRPYWRGTSNASRSNSRFKSLLILASLAVVIYLVRETAFVPSRWWDALDHKIGIAVAGLLSYGLLVASMKRFFQSGKQILALLLCIWTLAPLLLTELAPAIVTWTFGSEYREDLWMRKVRTIRGGCSRIEGWVGDDGGALMPGTGTTISFCVGPGYASSMPRARWYRLSGRKSALGYYFTDHEELVGKPILRRVEPKPSTFFFRRPRKPQSVSPRIEKPVWKVP